MAATQKTSNLTLLLVQWKDGDKAALDRLVPLVLPELRRIAKRCLAGERAGHTMQATDLVDEAYIRLLGCEKIDWQSRLHFLAMVAKLMRRILVDHARAKNVQKRGGGAERVEMPDEIFLPVKHSGIIATNDGLEAFAKINPRGALVIELKYFGGFTNKEIASYAKVSVDTVMRDHRLAIVWMKNYLKPGR